MTMVKTVTVSMRAGCADANKAKSALCAVLAPFKNFKNTGALASAMVAFVSEAEEKRPEIGKRILEELQGTDVPMKWYSRIELSSDRVVLQLDEVNVSRTEIQVNPLERGFHVHINFGPQGGSEVYVQTIYTAASALGIQFTATGRSV